MRLTSHPLIVCRYCEVAGQWQAWFDGAPCVTYGADLPMTAVHRLLAGSGTPPGELELHVDQDMVGSGVLTRKPIWKPPELLFKCERCNGKGEYRGLLTVETCRACQGRGWLVG